MGWLVMVLLPMGAVGALASEYFVSEEGSDDNDGVSKAAAFATVQRGVDALQPGDTLTIGPGEYFGSVRREGMGAEGLTTTIRAAIPGTVLLRGDVEAPVFAPVEGYDFVYVADLLIDDEVQVVNELDTATVLQGRPNFDELEFMPGHFHQDVENGKLYVSSSDGRPVGEHFYSLSVVPEHGIYLSDAVGVVVDGIAVTGFNTARLIDRRDRSLHAVWGIFIADGRNNVIRNAHAYLNGRGIGMNSNDPSAGDNLIEHSTARLNFSQFSTGDTGGITLISPRRDMVRDSLSILNGPYGINIRYVSTEGDDAADGLSVATAWRTLGRAFAGLSAGDTLYIKPGIYDEDVAIQLQGEAGKPIFIRGRGDGEVILFGSVEIEGSRHVNFERLFPIGEVAVRASENIQFRNCHFVSGGRALLLEGSGNVEVKHCLFGSYGGETMGMVGVEGSENIRFAGNLYANHQRPAIEVDRVASIRYADYNAFHDGEKAWRIAGETLALDEVVPRHEGRSIAQPVELVAVGESVRLANRHAFAGRGPKGRQVGPYAERIPSREIRLVTDLRVHSVSATTANIEWKSSLPATAHLSWGESPESGNDIEFEANHFANFSLGGLEPNTTYHVRLHSLRIPDRLDIVADPLAFSDQTISFTTRATDAAPRTLYVSVDGSNEHPGDSPQQALRTIQEAANRVNVGDTVVVGEGTYPETVRIRASGTEDAPITFRAAPGARVLIDGSERALNQGFVVNGKSHLHFDGFQFREFNFSPGGTGHWPPAISGEFNLTHSDHIRISRCLSDGRGTNTARSVTASFVEHLHISNCVSTNKMSGGMYIVDSPHLRVEHSVFARPMINAFLVRRGNVEAVFENNIFTDMLEKKAVQNIALFGADGGSEGLRMVNNAHYLRSFPPEERHLLGSTTAFDTDKITHPLFADPMFKGAVALIEAGVGSEFMPDRLMHGDIDFDFETFMATNPKLVERGIGLQPELFENGQPK